MMKHYSYEERQLLAKKKHEDKKAKLGEWRKTLPVYRWRDSLLE